MKKTMLQLLFFLSVLPSILSAQSRYTAFYPGAEWKDNNGVHINAHGGGVLYHEGTYYWFGEHKIAGPIGNTAQVGVHVYSSADLMNWKDEGIALPVSDDPESPIVKGCVIERPKVVYNERTKKFVMWFHLEKGVVYTASMCGVAVADRPTGPYTFVRAGRVNPGQYPVNVLALHKIPVPEKVYDLDLTGGILQLAPGAPRLHPDELNILGRDLPGGQMSRDQTVFVDDDGKAYRIYSSETNSTTHIAELTDDYLDHTGKYVRVFVNRYMEAPAVFKKDELYYLMASDCTSWAPNEARSAVAPSIWGPWQELGNPCVGEGAELTFHSQSTYILPMAGKENAFIYMGDRWTPENPIDGRYVWLPIYFEDGKFRIEYLDEWGPDCFK